MVEVTGDGVKFWPRWRGPSGQGIVAPGNYTNWWSPTAKIKWRTQVPGSGNSSPIVWGDRVYLTTAQNNGQTLFLNQQTDGGVLTCVFCHRQPFGTDGLSTFEGEPQEFKVAHLRNLYQKVGRFGVAGGATVGDQIRGFGFLHDGAVSTVQNFVSSPVFQNLSLTQEHTPQRAEDWSLRVHGMGNGNHR